MVRQTRKDLEIKFFEHGKLLHSCAFVLRACRKPRYLHNAASRQSSGLVQTEASGINCFSGNRSKANGIGDQAIEM